MSRQLIWRVLAVIAVLLPTGAVMADKPARTAPRPNILIIVTDDQRFDTQFEQVMPSTHQTFGDHGVRFPNGIVTTSLCCPSRASIFSGLYAHNHGVHTNGGNALIRWDPTTTLQHELKRSGYKTAISGKFLSTWNEAPPDFDRWAIQIRPSANSYNNATFNVDGETLQADAHSTEFTRDQALTFLEHFESQADGSPWFMQISPLAPHLPAIPMDEHRGADLPPKRQAPSLHENTKDKPAFVRAPTPGDVAKKRYRQWVHSKSRRMNRSLMGVDSMIADVYAWLEANGEADNTLAFFISDNGFMLGEHGLVKKQVPYEEAIRVPFFMRWPAGGVTPGSVRDDIAANIDIAATVYDAAEVKPGYTVDGRSLLSGDERKRILIESHDDRKVPAWTGLWTPTEAYFRYSTGEREYYDLSSDPYQLQNLLGNRTISDDPNTEPLDAELEEATNCTGQACP